MATSVNDAMALSMYVCVGEPTDDQLQKIRTRKPEAPVIEVDMKDGSKKKLWCTFGAQQIDIDPFSKPGTPPLPCPALPCQFRPADSSEARLAGRMLCYRGGFWSCSDTSSYRL